ncbi:MAG: DUF2062 domain-containing protein [Pirellulaceae bacterium]|nr:DUF2062 domain-containing protein [Pirellulaceae bacterium]
MNDNMEISDLSSEPAKALPPQDIARSRRWALGLAAGMLIGVLPKDSILPWILAICLTLTTANLLIAALAAAVFTVMSQFWDALAHSIGGMILAHDDLEWFWVVLYETPFMPWTRFNNTVVMGNLALGIICCVPLYLLGCQIFNNCGTAILRLIRGNRFTGWMTGLNEDVARS